MRLLDRPDTHKAITSHIDTCADFLARIRKSNELRIGPFFVMGVPVSGMGIDCQSISIGLAEHVGKAVSPTAWREILRSGKLPIQFPVVVRNQPRSPSPAAV